MSISKKNLNRELLSNFSSGKSQITVPTLYYRLTKSLHKAYLLNQVIFYSNKSTHSQDGWFFKSYKDWKSESYLPERTLRTFFKGLEKDDLIETRIATVNGLRTIFFRPKLDNVSEAIQKMLDDDSKKQEQNDYKSSHIELYKNCPNRQEWPDRPANIAGCSPSTHYIYTEEDTEYKTLVDFNKSPSKVDEDEFEMYAGTFEYHGEVFEGYSNLVEDYVGFDEEDITTLTTSEPVISPQSEVSVVSNEVVKAQVVAEVTKESKSDYHKTQTQDKPSPSKTKHSLKDYAKDARFMAFYGLYPNKKKPWFAYKAFLQLHPDDELLKRLITDVKARHATEWKNRPKKMIPHPATYLNKGEWEGEIDDYPQEENTQQYVPTYTYGHGLGTDMMRNAI